MISGYFNVDNGTGKIRGIYTQGNIAIVPIFAQWIAPLKDLGVTTITERNTGGTDHLSLRRRRAFRASSSFRTCWTTNAHASLEHGYVRATAGRRPGAVGHRRGDLRLQRCHARPDDAAQAAAAPELEEQRSAPLKVMPGALEPAEEPKEKEIKIKTKK